MGFVQVFDRLAAGELNGKPDAWTHAALCLALRSGSQYLAVLEVYATMRDQDMPIYKDVFYAVLEACERLGLWKEGREVLRHIQVGTFCISFLWVLGGFDIHLLHRVVCNLKSFSSLSQASPFL